MRDIEVKLNAEERQYLEDYVKKGKHSARAIKRANVLLLLDQGKSGQETSDRARVSGGTVSNIRTRYKEENRNVIKVIEENHDQDILLKSLRKLKPILPRLPVVKPLMEEVSGPPLRWSQRLLVEKVVELGYADSLSYEAVRKCLKKANRTAAAQAVAEKAVVH